MEAVGTLAGGVAHDFNNQLAVMLGNTRYALDCVDEPGDTKEALIDVVRAAEHCAQLTRALLAFSRRTPVESRPLDVAHLLTDVRDLVVPLLPASIDMDIRLPVDLDWVQGDPTQLQQVLINLVVNARDALPDGGRLELSARNRWIGPEEGASMSLARPGACVEMNVRDTGAGMTPEVAGRVFEPFFTTKDVGAGTGLGLATAYGILQQSGGAITFDTELGVGTTFRVLLPTTVRPDGEVEARRASPATGGSETVLLVEDEPALRRLIKRMLEGRGYRVLEAANGEEGLRIAEANLSSLDLLITDFVMPVMSGETLARQLVALDAGIPVLFLSGYADGTVGAAADELENSLFLQKPFGEEAFFAAIRRLLDL